ncbi:MAG: hypothetical protein ACI87W_003241 [Halieaceae bacterium]|jgi:hypothetical protein
MPRKSRYEDLRDLYSEKDRFAVTNKDRNDVSKDYDKLEPWEQRAFDRAIEEDKLLYFLDFENIGGVPTPRMLDIDYEDGSQRSLELPAEIWRRNSLRVTHQLIEDRPISHVYVDQHPQTADANHRNNRYPPEIHQSRLSVYKSSPKKRNQMADLLHKLKDSGKTGAQDDKAAPLEAVNEG